MKRLPLPLAVAPARTLPPWARAMLRTIARPRPEPVRGAHRLLRQPLEALEHAVERRGGNARRRGRRTRSRAGASRPRARDLDVHLAARVAHRVVEQVAERDAELLGVAAQPRRLGHRDAAPRPFGEPVALARVVRRTRRAASRRRSTRAARAARRVRAAWMIWSIVRCSRSRSSAMISRNSSRRRLGQRGRLRSVSR